MTDHGLDLVQLERSLNRALEARLTEWGSEYRGGRYENIGWPSKNVLATIRDHAGFMPDSQIAKRIPVRTNADDVENAVQALLRINFKAAQILRVEYLTDHLPEQEKLAKLRRMGIPCSRAYYYDKLRLARAFVGGYLAKEEKAA